MPSEDETPDMMAEMLRTMKIKQRISTCESVATYYLGLQDLKFHRMLYDIVDRSGHKQIIIPAPRDFGKSTAIAYVLPIKRILNNLNYRILIAQKRRDQARKSVRLLKEVFESNTKILEDFGDLRGTPWESDMFYVKRTLKGTAMKDPTVEGVGVLGAITGGHFDLIILDDILDEENTKTELKRQRIDEWLRGTIMPLAEANTQIICICTRKHYRDVYGWLLENPFFYHPSCKYEYYGHHNSCGFSAIIKEPQYEYVWDEAGKTIVDVKIKGDYEVLEDRLPKAVEAGIPVIKWLLMKRGEVGEVYFRREYQNDPSGMEGIFFRDEWLNRWVWPHEWHDSLASSRIDHRILPPLGEMMMFISIDPAIKKGTHTDYFAMCVFGIDSANRVYLIDTYRDKLDFTEQVDAIVRRAREIRPYQIFVEANAYQDALRQQTQSLMSFPIVPVKTSKDKKLRAIAISPFLEQGRVYVNDNQEEFWNEYRQFPSGKHDDLIDAFMLGIESIMIRNPAEIDYVMFGREGEVLHGSLY